MVEDTLIQCFWARAGPSIAALHFVLIEWARYSMACQYVFVNLNRDVRKCRTGGLCGTVGVKVFQQRQKQFRHFLQSAELPFQRSRIKYLINRSE